VGRNIKSAVLGRRSNSECYEQTCGPRGTDG